LETDDTFLIPVMNVSEGNGRYTKPSPFEVTPSSEQSTKTILEIVRLLFGENIDALKGQPLMLMPFDIS